LKQELTQWRKACEQMLSVKTLKQLQTADCIHEMQQIMHVHHNVIIMLPQMTMNTTLNIKIKITSMSKQNILKMLVIFNIKYK
jgi:hypothetical protein